MRTPGESTASVTIREIERDKDRETDYGCCEILIFLLFFPLESKHPLIVKVEVK